MIPSAQTSHKPLLVRDAIDAPMEAIAHHPKSALVLMDGRAMTVALQYAKLWLTL
jgi:hypothetical protein